MKKDSQFIDLINALEKNIMPSIIYDFFANYLKQKGNILCQGCVFEISETYLN